MIAIKIGGNSELLSGEVHALIAGFFVTILAS